jgi:uncharacterized membrane protein YqiK
MGMIQITQDPEIAQVLQSMAIMNMEGEGISDVRDFFRERLLRLGVVKPTQEEAMRLMEEQMQAQQAQDPNAIFLQAAAEEAIAKAARARADTVRTVADSELIRAKTVETLAKVDMDVDNQAIAKMALMGEMARESAVQAPVSLPQRPPEVL